MNSFLIWANDIPIDWEILAVKVLGKYVVSSVDKIPSEDENPVLLCNYSEVYNNDFITSDIQFMKGTATLEEKKKFSLRDGDLIITKDSESWDDIGVPSLVIENIPELICGYHLAIIRPDKKRILPQFLFRCLQSKDIRLQLELSSTGVTRFGLPKEAIGSMKVPVPSIEKQNEIVAFLEKEIVRIDKLIETKQQLIDILSEKRQILITEGIVNGVNPNVSMKDSGIDWLGSIPMHWNTERTRWLFKERNERSENGEEEMLTVSHITGVTPRSEKNVNMFQAESTAGYKKCNKGDLVINTLWAWMGAMGIAPMEGIVSPAYHVYTPCSLLLPEFVDAIVRLPIFAAEVTRYSKGVWSSRLRLYPEGFYEVYFPVPPINEQREIVNNIRKETKKIDQLKTITERSIGLLKERRAALISAAVTGQIEIAEEV